MKRSLKYVLTAALAVGLSSPVWAQTGGSSSSGGRGSGNQGSTGAGQTGAGQTGNNAAANQAQGLNNSFRFGGINQTPWFMDPTLRSDLRLNDNQFNQLSNLYSQYYNQYSNSLGQLGTLSDQERALRMQQLGLQFNQNFGNGLNDVLQGDQRTRFNQLWFQYQGLGLFLDPTIQQRLNLTAQQLQQLRQIEQQYNTQLNEIYQTLGTNRGDAMRRFTELRRRVDDQVNSLLTPDQRTGWRQMLGDPFNFQLALPPANQNNNQNNQNQNNQNQSNQPNRPAGRGPGG